MPSLSLSRSGQPSSSWKPSLSSGQSGHLSISSATPSASLSASGQPSPSSKPSVSSSAIGQESTASGMLSASESRLFAGQPSFGYGSLPSSASFGHLSARSSILS